MAVALLSSLLPSCPVGADDGPITVRGDNRRSVDIRVRDGGRKTQRPAPPRATDAPEECLVPNASLNALCLAGSGGSGVPALAEEARSRLTLPLPAPALRPLVHFADGTRGGLRGVPVWLWTDPGPWRTPLTRTVRAGTLSATVAAAPVRITWHPGDGAGVVCRNPGTPLTDPADGPGGSPDCGHTYRHTGGYRMTIAITWAVTWAGSDGSGGTLAPLVVTASFGYPVRDSRAQLVS
ncbi:hypothetical protein [Cryptosporangium sp. NPDC051539]|uniref:hypothetical protein n=1 Tax=Cryptosporangium sp. NPDC051539 TaxID=3363962 RepID=UPI0037AAF72B